MPPLLQQTIGALERVMEFAQTIMDILIGGGLIIFLGLTAFKFMQGEPDAGKRMIFIVIGIVVYFGARALLGDLKSLVGAG